MNAKQKDPTALNEPFLSINPSDQALPFRMTVADVPGSTDSTPHVGVSLIKIRLATPDRFARVPKRAPPCAWIKRRRFCACCLLCWMSFVLGALLTAVLIRAIARHQLGRVLSLMASASYNATVDDGTVGPLVDGGRGMYTMVVDPHNSLALDLHPLECTLLGTFFVRICDRNITVMERILCGAHVLVQGDNAWYYRVIKTMKEAYRRRSSHDSVAPMYGIPEGFVLHTILTGTRAAATPGGLFGDTWFQFEGAEWSPFKNPADSFVHFLNFLEYRITGRNVGPLGTSQHTDWNPLVVPWTNYTASAAAAPNAVETATFQPKWRYFF